MTGTNNFAEEDSKKMPLQVGTLRDVALVHLTCRSMLWGQRRRSEDNVPRKTRVQRSKNNGQTYKVSILDSRFEDL